jgi:ABC-2 type transport system permease protein
VKGPPGATSGRRSSGLGNLVELRFRLASRRFRARGGAAEGVAKLLLLLLALPLGVLFAVLVGAGSFTAARAGRGAQATIAVSAILFGIWQTWTAVSLTMNERDAIDLRRLLVYPVAPSRLYLLGLCTSVVGDPFAAFWLMLLAGMVCGAAVARPGGWVVLLGLVVAVFAAATVALIALAQELLGRLARSRLWREALVVAAVAGWLLLVATTAGGARVVRSALPTLRVLRWILFPAALATEASQRLYASQLAAALPWLGLLAAAALATGWLAYRIALSTAVSGGEAPGARASADARGGASLFPERWGPLFEKEVRYLARHPAARIAVLVLPPLAALLAWKMPRPAGDDLAELAGALPLFGLAAYVHLAFQIFWVNGLGWERGGARTLFLAPVPPERVLAAKNLALFAWTAMVFALSAAAYIAVSGPLPAWALAGAVALEVGLAPVLYGLGNVLGVVTPRVAPFGIQRTGSVSPLAAFAAMGITSGALGVFAVPVLLALWLDALWTVPVAWAALAVAAAVAWRLTLPLSGRLLVRRREQVLAAVCGDEV